VEVSALRAGKYSPNVALWAAFASALAHEVPVPGPDPIAALKEVVLDHWGIPFFPSSFFFFCFVFHFSFSHTKNKQTNKQKGWKDCVLFGDLSTSQGRGFGMCNGTCCIIALHLPADVLSFVSVAYPLVIILSPPSKSRNRKKC
jgi:hypothetical protein